MCCFFFISRVEFEWCCLSQLSLPAGDTSKLITNRKMCWHSSNRTSGVVLYIKKMPTCSNLIYWIKPTQTTLISQLSLRQCKMEPPWIWPIWTPNSAFHLQFNLLHPCLLCHYFLCFTCALLLLPTVFQLIFHLVLLLESDPRRWSLSFNACSFFFFLPSGLIKRACE